MKRETCKLRQDDIWFDSLNFPKCGFFAFRLQVPDKNDFSSSSQSKDLLSLSLKDKYIENGYFKKYQFALTFPVFSGY